MSVWSNIVSFALDRAAIAAQGLPVEGSGTLSTQIKIFGVGATGSAAAGEAAAHGHEPYVAVAAVLIGVGALAFVPEIAVGTIVAAALPYVGGLISEAALAAIIEGVIAVGISAIVESLANSAITAAIDEVNEYADDSREYAEDPSQLGPHPLPDWMSGPTTPATPEEMPLGNWVPTVLTPFGQAEAAVSPIVLDVDGSGTIELAALNGAGSVFWDIDQDGFTEASGWITGGDGLLAIDLNSDGVINDHGELFGGANGYATLDAYDTDNDNAITSADTQFGDLLVWIDSNADGYSQSAELHTLASLGISSISTSYSNVSYSLAGNPVLFESTFVMNGNTYASVDAFFAYDPANTRYAAD